MAVTISDQIKSVRHLPDWYEAEEFMSTLLPGDNFYWENGIYEVWTDLYVNALSDILNHIGSEPIIEVCAGNGKLSYHLRKRGIPITATDNYKDRSTTLANLDLVDKIIVRSTVVRLNHREALKRYNPKIVVASWVPDFDQIIAPEILNYASVEHFLHIGDIWSTGCDELIEQNPRARALTYLENLSLSRTYPSAPYLLSK